MINVTGNGKYSITYSIWDQKSIELGDTDNKGFFLQDEQIEDLSDLDEIIKEMSYLNEAHWSCSDVKSNGVANGTIYFSGISDQDIITGDITDKSYHFSGLSEEEAQYIIKQLK